MNLEQLRKFCLALPAATEDVKWGSDLCFCVGAKMFCVTGIDAAGGGVSIKCTPEKFAQLTELEGIIPAQYVARYHWVTIQDLNAVARDELRDLIRNSYEMVRDKLPKRLRNQIG